MSLKRIGYVVTGILISLFFLWFSIKDIEFSNLKIALLQSSPGYISIMLLAIACFFICKTLRWQLFLYPKQSVPFSKLFPSLMVGTAAGYILFPYVGEIVRVLYLSNNSRISKSLIVGTIFFERVFDLLTVFFVIIIAEIFAEEVVPLRSIAFVLFFIGLFFLVLIIGVVTWTKPFLRIFQCGLGCFSESFQQNCMRNAEKGIEGFHSIFSFRLVTRLLLLSFTQWIIMGFIHYFSIVALGIEVPISAAFLVMGLIICGFILPTLPGQIGLIEFCYVVVLGPYGVSTTYALAAAIIYHVVLYLSVVLVGFFYLKDIELSYKNL